MILWVLDDVDDIEPGSWIRFWESGWLRGDEHAYVDRRLDIVRYTGIGGKVW
jgi:hypothetical protein